MSKYATGQTCTVEHDEVHTGVSQILAHTETLTILEVLPKVAGMFRMPATQTYKVSRHFVADGVDTTNTVTLTEREIDSIVD